MYHCRLVKNKCINLVGDTGKGGGLACMMAGLGTVMVPVGVSCSSLMCYIEVQGLVEITSSPS